MNRLTLILLLPLMLTSFAQGHCTSREYPLSLAEALSSEYPIPLSLSSDGKHLLRRTLTHANHIALDVLNLRTHSVIHLPDLDGEVLRATWSPRGDLVAFYLQGRERDRRLYVWHLIDNKVQQTTALSQAELLLTWSPNESFIATLDGSRGIILTSISNGASTLIARAPVRTLCFTPDGAGVAYVASGSPNQLIFKNISGTILKVISLPSDLALDEIQWQPGGTNLAFIYDRDKKSGIGVISGRKPAHANIFEDLHGSLRDVAWNNGNIVWVDNKQNTSTSTIYSFSIPGRHLAKITNVSGIADIRGSSTATRSFGYIVRGNRPAVFSVYSFDSGVSAAANAPQSLLPHTQPKVIVLSDTTTQCHALLWNASSPSAAVVRFHGRGADELPVWQPDIQFFVSKHVSYLSVVYEEDKTNDLVYQSRIVTAALHFLEKHGIPPDRTVLLGFSAGADFVVHALDTSSIHVRSAVLYGINVAKCSDVFSHAWHGPTPVTFIYGLEDSDNIITNALLAKLQSSGMRAVSVDDTHLLIHPASWLRVQQTVDDSLHQ